jgi:hypothetical protein
MLLEIPLWQHMLEHHVKCFLVVLAVPFNVDQLWLKHLKAIFYILLLKLIHSLDLNAYACIKNCNGLKGHAVV